MVATVDGDRIVKVVGDRGHPASRGYTCAKGRAIVTQHHSPHRLDRPRLHGEEVSWEVLLDDLAGRVQALIADGGPDRIARYAGTGMTWDVGMFAARRLLRGLGTKQLYSAKTLDSAPPLRAAELVTGFADTVPAWTPDDPSPTLAVLVGVDPSTSGGYLGTPGGNWPQRLRAFRRRGGELWVIDPRRTKTAAQADRHLAARPGSDVFLLAWLVRELMESGFDRKEVETACDPADVQRLLSAVAPFGLTAVAGRTGLQPADLVDLVAAVRRHRQVAIMGGTGASFTPTGVLTYWLMWAAMIITGSLDRPGGLRLPPSKGTALDGPPRQGHAPEEGAYSSGPISRPDLAGVLGERPAVALVDEIEAGEVQALFIFGGNPLTAAPRPDSLRKALAHLEVLAVFDAFDTPLTQLATHAIPCTWITERKGFFHSPGFLGLTRSYYSPALVAPTAERRHAWWVLGQLGRRLGLDVLKGLDCDTVDDDTVLRQSAEATCDFSTAVIKAGTYGVEVPNRFGWFHGQILPGGRWRLAPRVLADRLGGVWSDSGDGLRLINGRIASSVNSAAYAQPRDGPPPIHVSVDVAREQGLVSGNRIRVGTDFGSIEGRVRVDATLAPQSVWVNHGWLAQNVNRLTDPVPDPLTGQPFFTGVRARVERL
jgi:anaerobic selenocysteine-containing dehydrogenase